MFSESFDCRPVAFKSALIEQTESGFTVLYNAGAKNLPELTVEVAFIEIDCSFEIGRLFRFQFFQLFESLRMELE